MEVAPLPWVIGASRVNFAKQITGLSPPDQRAAWATRKKAKRAHSDRAYRATKQTVGETRRAKNRIHAQNSRARKRAAKRAAAQSANGLFASSPNVGQVAATGNLTIKVVKPAPAAHTATLPPIPEFVEDPTADLAALGPTLEDFPADFNPLTAFLATNA